MIATRPFSLAAIETCERDGHRFAWVRTWEDCGYDECRVCGVMGRQGRRLTLPSGEVVDADGAGVDAGEQPHEAVGGLLHRDAARLDLAKDQHEGLGVAHAVQHTTRRPGGSRPRNPERDAAILRSLDAGERPTDIAAKWGVSPSRISQIAKRARRTRGNQ